MKGLMIKIEKAAAVLKRNGLRKGARIVSGYALDFARAMFVGSGDILYVTGGVGDSAMYRARNAAETLRNAGFRASATVSDNPILPFLSDKFGIVIFHRVDPEGRIAETVRRLKAQGKEIIFDADDLLFDPRYLEFVEYYRNAGNLEMKRYENGIGRGFVEDPYVKVATASTSYLGDKLKGCGKKAFVVRNRLSEKEVRLADFVLSRHAKIADERVCLGYFSGTPSHDKDLATITEPLCRVLEKHPKARLILAGPVKVSEKLAAYQDRIGVLPRVPRSDYYDNLFKVDINLVPLEKDNPFCEAKSEIKFIEAGIMRIPTVAVRNRTFSEAIEDGLSGMLAGTADEWVDKIGQLVENEGKRRMMGEDARGKVLRRYTTKSEPDDDFHAYLRKRLAEIRSAEKNAGGKKLIKLRKRS